MLVLFLLWFIEKIRIFFFINEVFVEVIVFLFLFVVIFVSIMNIFLFFCIFGKDWNKVFVFVSFVWRLIVLGIFFKFFIIDMSFLWLIFWLEKFIFVELMLLYKMIVYLIFFVLYWWLIVLIVFCINVKRFRDFIFLFWMVKFMFIFGIVFG